MKILAIGERVIVKIIDEEKTKSGSIYLPQIRNTRGTEGIVTNVGYRITESGEKEQLPLEIGDIVFFGNITGYELRSEELEKDEAKYWALNYSDIFAVKKENKNAR